MKKRIERLSVFLCLLLAGLLPFSSCTNRFNKFTRHEEKSEPCIIADSKGWVKAGSFSCNDIIRILQNLDEINAMFVEKTCAGRSPALVVFLKNSGITVKLYTVDNFVYDYLNLSPDEYLDLYRNDRVRKIAIFKERELIPLTRISKLLSVHF